LHITRIIFKHTLFTNTGYFDII